MERRIEDRLAANLAGSRTPSSGARTWSDEVERSQVTHH